MLTVLFAIAVLVLLYLLFAPVARNDYGRQERASLRNGNNQFWRKSK